MTTTKSAALAWLHAIENNDMDAYRASLTDDVCHEVMGSCALSGKRDKAESCALVSQLVDAFADGVRFDIETVTAEEDRVAVEFRGYAELSSGGSYNNSYHVLFQIRDGKICHIREYADTKLVDDVLASMSSSPARQ